VVASSRSFDACAWTISSSAFSPRRYDCCYESVHPHRKAQRQRRRPYLSPSFFLATNGQNTFVTSTLLFAHQRRYDERNDDADNKDNNNSNDGDQDSSPTGASASDRRSVRGSTQLEDDIARRLSVSKDRAISALTHPNGSGRSAESSSGNDNQNNHRHDAENSILPPPPSMDVYDETRNHSMSNKNSNGNRSRRRERVAMRNRRQHQGSRQQRSDSANDDEDGLSNNIDNNSNRRTRRNRRQNDSDNNNNSNPFRLSRRQRHQRQRQVTAAAANNANATTFSSLLPPPLTTYSSEDNDDRGGIGDSLSSGLSSWEEFLGVTGERRDTSESSALPPSFGGGNRQNPSRLTNRPNDGEEEDPSGKSNSDEEMSPDRLPSIQDLFPPDLSSVAAAVTSPSSQSQSKSTPHQQQQMKQRQQHQQSLEGVLPVSDLFYRSSQSQGDHDDEELPFSAEQSDSLTSQNNRVNVQRSLTTGEQQSSSSQQQEEKTSKSEMGKRVPSSLMKRNGRRMVRRGMEMLVGGVPINADPPQRSVELNFDPSYSPERWAQAVTLNTRDFGPLLHTSSAPLLTDIEKGLFCEHFCYSTLKWDICPKDLREIVKSRSLQSAQTSGSERSAWENTPVHSSSVESTTSDEMAEETSNRESGLTHDFEDDEYNEALSVRVRPRDELTTKEKKQLDEENYKRLNLPSKAKGFGKKPNDSNDSDRDAEKQFFDAKTELIFDLSISKEDLESGQAPAPCEVFKSVLEFAFVAVVEKEFSGFRVDVSKLVLADKGDGSTGVDVEFTIANERLMTVSHVQRRLKRISAAFLQAVDDGDVRLAIAAGARLETRWSPDVVLRVVEECIFNDDDNEEDDGEDFAADIQERMSHAATQSRGSAQPRSDLFVGGGVDGIFPDYSDPLQSPYRGEIGLRLVDAVVQRAKERHPRVIAVGDVHGCIDELQDLLRQCDYRPGDLVIFLGDLVCKGPDSISVVQMAREIGAIAVRGNHDFEVIRWHQAIKSGVDPPVVGSEHFHIASCLSKADMKWMYNLPWFVSSKELGSLFVHAGFVSGIRLAKQK